MVYSTTPPPLLEDLGEEGVQYLPQLKQTFIQVVYIQNIHIELRVRELLECLIR